MNQSSIVIAVLITLVFFQNCGRGRGESPASESSSGTCVVNTESDCGGSQPKIDSAFKLKLSGMYSELCSDPQASQIPIISESPVLICRMRIRDGGGWTGATNGALEKMESNFEMVFGSVALSDLHAAAQTGNLIQPHWSFWLGPSSSVVFRLNNTNDRVTPLFRRDELLPLLQPSEEDNAFDAFNRMRLYSAFGSFTGSKFTKFQDGSYQLITGTSCDIARGQARYVDFKVHGTSVDVKELPGSLVVICPIE